MIATDSNPYNVGLCSVVAPQIRALLQADWFVGRVLCGYRHLRPPRLILLPQTRSEVDTARLVRVKRNDAQTFKYTTRQLDRPFSLQIAYTSNPFGRNLPQQLFLLNPNRCSQNVF
jgi:hypothetical protein